MKKVVIEAVMIDYSSGLTGLSTQNMESVLSLGNQGYTKIYDIYEGTGQEHSLICTPEDYEVLRNDNTYIYKIIDPIGSTKDIIFNYGYDTVEQYMDECAIPEDLATEVVVRLFDIITGDL